LLGHCRDGGFIEHDCDIDLGMMEADYRKRGPLIELLRARGYTVRLNTDHEFSFMRAPFDVPGGLHCCCVDIFRFSTDGEGVSYSLEDSARHELHTYLFSADIFARFQPVKFMNRLEVLIPGQPEKFLEQNYGDWRTPKPDFDLWRDHINEKKQGGSPSL
jgi:phosphorylcholine metabolism protein LicD